MFGRLGLEDLDPVATHRLAHHKHSDSADDFQNLGTHSRNECRKAKSGRVQEWHRSQLVEGGKANCAGNAKTNYREHNKITDPDDTAADAPD